MIDSTPNIKHRCVLSLLYSAGLRRSELIQLKIADVNSDRMVITVRSGKGGKDRITLLSKKLLSDLRTYYRQYRPKLYLIEGAQGEKYSASSIAKVVKYAPKR